MGRLEPSDFGSQVERFESLFYFSLSGFWLRCKASFNFKCGSFLSFCPSFFLSFYAWPFFNPILDLFWSPKVAKDQGEEIAQDLEKVGEKEREKHVKIGKQRSSFFFLFILFLCLLPLFHSVAISSFLFVLLFIFWWFQEVLVTERYGTICSTGTWYCNMFL